MTLRSSGTVSLQAPMASSHRGAKTQPLGRLSGRGGWPAIDLIGLFTSTV